jgi:ATP-dependent exoDNAse (exonuclease V) alpha subunit
VICVQLADLLKREQHLSRLLRKRAQATLDSLREPWDTHLRETIREQGDTVDLCAPRYVEALKEQGEALETITTRKLSVLAGGVGTGKTTALGAFKKSKLLAKQGVLFLAPIGKARVRLGQKTGDPSMMVARYRMRRRNSSCFSATRRLGRSWRAGGGAAGGWARAFRIPVSTAFSW